MSQLFSLHELFTNPVLFGFKVLLFLAFFTPIVFVLFSPFIFILNFVLGIRNAFRKKSNQSVGMDDKEKHKETNYFWSLGQFMEADDKQQNGGTR